MQDPRVAQSAARLTGIEGLRALAALSVLVYHVAIFVPFRAGGRLDLPEPLQTLALDSRSGLTLFFVLSGFLLFRPFVDGLLGDRGKPDVRRYLRNRALRILPLYYVVFVVTAWIFQTATQGPEIGILDDPKSIVLSLFLVQSLHPDTLFAGIGPAWSLTVEIFFYFSLPLLALGGAALIRRGVKPLAAVLALPGVLLVTGLVSKAIYPDVGERAGDWGRVIGTSFPVAADLFAYGMFAAVVWTLISTGRLQIAEGVRRLLLPVAVGLFALALLWAGSDPGIESATFQDALVGLACAVGVLGVTVAGPGRRRVAATLESKPFVHAGLWSYGIYLWHVPLLFLFTRWGLSGFGGLDLLVAGITILAGTLVLSALTYRFVEAPALARKQSQVAAGLGSAKREDTDDDAGQPGTLTAVPVRNA